ncbi:MAG: molybdenum cofactor guanylyltransferase [Acidobacteria bacterium]|nr:molybdenum cofactor guanylyltransferase [Acidobacteriota bacterium]
MSAERAAFVLAGGASRRMGRDKALLPLAGRPLIEQIARRAAAVASPVTIVGSPAKYQGMGFNVIADRRPDCGPLAGIEAALEAGLARRNLILACDMPHLDSSLLERLFQGDAACVLPETPDGRWHPLCAVWDQSLLPSVRAALDRQEFRVRAALAGVAVQVVPVDQLSNANTPEEWTALAG